MTEITPLKEIALVCTLNPSSAPSSSDLPGSQILTELPSRRRHPARLHPDLDGHSAVLFQSRPSRTTAEGG
jgi:hypothetical protein